MFISVLTPEMEKRMEKTIGMRIRECRKEKNFTQMQVSIYCDITERAYQNYELMYREPKIEILVRIADLYDVSLDYLCGRTDEK